MEEVSTKIYSGFKAINVEIKQLMIDLLQIQSAAKQIAQNLSWEYQIHHATILFDKVCLGEAESIKHSYYGECYAKLLEEQREVERTNMRNMSVDYSFSICIYPTQNNEFLGMYFTEWEPKYLPLLKAYPWYNEYGYWNNSDKPNKITQREWNKRRDDWEILKLGVPTNECMLTLECVKCVNYGAWIKPDSSFKVLSFDDRIRIATARRLRITHPNVDFRESKDKELQKLVKTIKSDLKQKLVQDLTLEMLLTEN